MPKKIIKGYKAFNKGLICQNQKYEVGKEYKYDGELKLCEMGFHFCENPLDVLNYYNLCDSEFAEIESKGKVIKNKDKDKDSKIVTNHLKISAKLDLTTFIQASINFLQSKCPKKNKNIQSSSGDRSQLASSGDRSQLASSGNESQLASSGDRSKLASSGNESQLASSGYGSQLASSGYGSKLASSGYGSQLASSGDWSKLASSGYGSKLLLNGQNSIGANIGIDGKIKGKKGCWITLAEHDNNYKIICMKSIKIDGKKIKEDTWYQLKEGKFVEVE